MELRQLRYFEAVAERRHFTRAAEDMHVAQSALSHQIAKLEGELGIALLSRSSRRVEITEAGELVRRHARRILEEVAEIEAGVADLQGLVQGTVRLGGMVPLGPLDLAELLATFHARHPGVEVALHEGTTAELHALVRRGDLDLALSLASAAGLDDALEDETLFDEEIVVVAAPGHPLASSERPLRTSALAAHPLVAFYPRSATREAIDGRLADDGVRPKVVFESSLVEVVRRLVAHGLGIALLPRSAVSGPGEPVVIRSLTPRLTRPIVLVWRRGRERSPATAAFLGHVREAAAAS